MNLVLTEDEQMLATTANEFIREKSPVQRLRALRDGGDGGDERGYSQALYREMGGLGWTAIPFTEAQGGMELGVSGSAVVAEAMGRGLAPEPLISSTLLAGHLLSQGPDALRTAWLGPIIAGEKVATVAYQEPGMRFDPAAITMKATPQGDGVVLDGEKRHVLDGHLADGFVVAARTAGSPGESDGLSLYWVPAGAAGLTCIRQRRADGRNAAILRFASVEVAEANRIGAAGQGGPLLQEALDRATVALCAEMLGSMTEAFERTLAYLKERKQFGVLIGSFQALKHRAAKMFIEVELSRSVTLAAARALDDEDPQASALVSVAKARCSDAFNLIANEAVQMHGGIGMTDEHEIGFFMKRARGAEMTFGDAAYHRDRFARLSGY